jgi:hypothetical protein
MASVQSDGSIPFDPGAINIYFIKDIEDSGIGNIGNILDFGTIAYTGHGIYFQQKPPPYNKYAPATVWMPFMDGNTPPAVVLEDSAPLSTAKAATVAAHEIGHALSLVHVCALQSRNENPADTQFQRYCGFLPTDPNKDTTDREYLMFPEMDWHSHTGATVTAEEGARARRAASRLHGK